jgi:hypothetical protein
MATATGKQPVQKGYMKKLLTRVLLGIAALALPFGVSTAFPMSAHAATGSSAATPGMSSGDHTYTGTINGNFDVPAGVSFYMKGSESTGNVTVEGYMFAANVTFDQNVTVSNGGHIVFNNQPDTIKKNLTMCGSSDETGFWEPVHMGTTSATPVMLLRFTWGLLSPS